MAVGKPLADLADVYRAFGVDELAVASEWLLPARQAFEHDSACKGELSELLHKHGVDWAASPPTSSLRLHLLRLLCSVTVIRRLQGIDMHIQLLFVVEFDVGL